MRAFDEYAYEVERLTDLRSGAILAAALYTVIDRKIARITIFPSEERALEAVGLSE